MKKYRLTGPQIICLAQKKYATQIFGVGDVFANDSVDEIKEALLDAEKELMMQGLINEDFDGNLFIEPTLSKCIEANAVFDTMLYCETIRNGHREETYFFALDEHITSMKKSGEEFELSESSMEEMAKFAEATLAMNTDVSTNPEVRTLFSSSLDILVRDMVEDEEYEEALELLENNGCDTNLGRVYLKSLSGDLDSIKFTFVHDPLYNIPDTVLSCIYDNKRMIGISSEVGEDFDEYLVLSEITVDEIRENILKNINEFTEVPSFQEDTGSEDINLETETTE